MKKTNNKETPWMLDKFDFMCNKADYIRYGSYQDLKRKYKDLLKDHESVLDMLNTNAGIGKYGTYEELSKKYEDLWSNYQSLANILDTTVGRLTYQNMMLDKAREAYKYITAEDRDKPIE